VRVIQLASIFLLLPAVSFAADRCPSSTAEIDGLLIAWTTKVGAGSDENGARVRVEAFRPVALLKAGALSETPGAEIAQGQEFWKAVAPQEQPVKLNAVNSYFDRTGTERCVFFATLSDTALPNWTLLTSKPVPDLFRAPTAGHNARFHSQRSSCIVQGDPPAGTPCTRAELLAVTDINQNGRLEYWATKPYKWYTGLNVWEDEGELLPILQVCVGCSE
jgi:hypothetical protein